MNKTLFLRVIASILLVFGFIYLLNPALLAGQAGLSADGSGLTDIRATYGGFQIGFALFLFWASGSEHMHAALVATLTVFASVGAGRFLGVLIDGELSGFNQIGLGFEIILTLACLYLLGKKEAPLPSVARQ